MGKRRSSSHDNETSEERKERKRLKKEATAANKSNHHHTPPAAAAATACTSSATAISTTSTTAVVTSSASQAAAAAATPSSASSSSLYYNKKLQVSVSLLPCGLRNVVQSAKESIRHALLLKYCNPMGGILLAFDNVQIVVNHNGGGSRSHGRILEELPHIHYDVTCNGLVFCPTVGLRMDGTVVEASFHSHLSLVVHGHFNASISSNQMRKAGFVYDENVGQWMHVASETFLQQQHDDDNQVNALLEEDDDADETNEQSYPRPASRIQFTLHKLHEVGALFLVYSSHLGFWRLHGFHFKLPLGLIFFLTPPPPISFILLGGIISMDGSDPTLPL
jgi:RPA43 OB domain in RNA Pol I